MAEPTQLAFRTLMGIGILNAAPAYESLPGFRRPEGTHRCCCYSPDGRFFAWASPEQVSVVDASTGNIATTVPVANVYELDFSPHSTFIITWQRPSRDEENNAVKNLRVWRTIVSESDAADRIVGQFVQRNQKDWNLQYTSDEMYCARVVTNAVQFYESGDLKTVWNALHLEGVNNFKVSPGDKSHSVAVFVPERKGQPAAIQVYNVPNFAAPVSQKHFFKGDKVELIWNSLGTSLIVLAQTDVDKSNQSYYGETTMYVLSANGGFDARIDLDKKGPIHEVAWSPNGKEFGVVYGSIPAKTTIFNQKAVAKHSFPLGPRNFIRFSPHGRFVLVAGFGNLAGQMDIYDLEKDYAKICTIEASNAPICEWSPDGQYILTATVSPRLRVDNGIRLWHVSGSITYNEEMTELYDVTWRPQPLANHPLGDPFNPAPALHPSAVDYTGRIKTPSKPVGAYRPPGARGTSTPLAFMREDQGGTPFVASSNNNGTGATPNGPPNGFSKPRTRYVPGADPVTEGQQLPPGAAPGGGVSLAGTTDGDGELSKTALKNKKKREAKRAKEAAERDHGLSVGDIDKDSGAARRPGRNNSRGDIPGLERSRSRGEGGLGTRRGERSERSRSRGKAGDAGGSRDYKKEKSKENGQGYGMADARPKGEAAGLAQAPPPPPPTIQTLVPAPPPDVTVTSPTTPASAGSQQEKKIRSLLKKLRAIDELRMRQAGGEKLENTQVQKIGTEGEVRRELEGLGYMG